MRGMKTRKKGGKGIDGRIRGGLLFLFAGSGFFLFRPAPMQGRRNKNGSRNVIFLSLLCQTIVSSSALWQVHTSRVRGT